MNGPVAQRITRPTTDQVQILSGSIHFFLFWAHQIAPFFSKFFLQKWHLNQDWMRFEGFKVQNVNLGHHLSQFFWSIGFGGRLSAVWGWLGWGG
jgi:hypothetical protein